MWVSRSRDQNFFDSLNYIIYSCKFIRYVRVRSPNELFGCRLVSRRLVHLDAKPPKPPAMPCRWFLISGIGKFEARPEKTPAPQQQSNPRRRGAPNRSTVELRCEMETPANTGHFPAFFACCGAGTRFVHLSFRLKSAFLGITYTAGNSGTGAPETTEPSCLILQS